MAIKNYRDLEPIIDDYTIIAKPHNKLIGDWH